MSEQGSRPRTQESTTFNRHLIHFYVHCTVFGIATAVAATAWIVFAKYPAAVTVGWVAAGIGVVTVVGALRALQHARGER